MRYIIDIITIRCLAMLAAALVFVGCAKEHSPSTPAQYPIVLAPSILDQTTQTKYAGGAEFANEDQISVYSIAWTTANEPVLSTNAADNNFHNAKFKRDNTYFNFEATASVTSVGFPPNGSNIDIYGIYPYNATPITSVTEHQVSSPIDQSSELKMLAGDFLMAKKSKVAPQLQPINLEFNHMMAKLYVDVKVAQDYKDINVTVTSVKFIAGVDAKINISTQQTPNPIPTVTTAITPLVTAKTVSADGCFAEAILAPQTFAANAACIEVTMSNAKTHTFSFSSNFELKFNTITELTLEVAFGASNAIKIATAKITDWATGADITPTDPVNQNSQNKFSITAAGNQTIAATVKYAAVFAVMSHEAHTYELPASYDAASKIINFEFRGVGNRPNIYPFTVTQIQYYNAAWALVATSTSYSLEVTAANQTISQTQNF